MLTSPGWRAEIPQRRILALFTLGAVLGGLLSASVLWLISGVMVLVHPGPRHALFLGAVVLALGREFGVFHFHIPENRRLIPKALFDRGPIRASLQFGFELGTGVRTYIPSTAPYVLAVAIVTLSPSIAVAALLGTSFGLGRSIMTWLRYLAPSKEEWDRRLDMGSGMISRVATASLAAWGTVLVVGGLVS